MDLPRYKYIHSTNKIKKVCTSNSNISERGTIPKNMFFAWQSHKMSWLRFASVYTFCKLNPDWNTYLYIDILPEKERTKPWGDPDAVQDFYTYDNTDYTYNLLEIENLQIRSFDEIPSSYKIPSNSNPVQKADFLMWILLDHYGGFFSDTDILYIKPMSTIYDSICKSDIVTCFYDMSFSVGFIGGTRNNKFFHDVYNIAHKYFMPIIYESAGIPCIHRLLLGKLTPDPKTKIKLQQKYPEYRICHLPRNTVYPFTKEQIFLDTVSKIDDTTVGIHWFGGYVLSQSFNEKITRENYTKIKNTFSYFCNKVLNYTQEEKEIQEKISSVSDIRTEFFGKVFVDDPYYNGYINIEDTITNRNFFFNDTEVLYHIKNFIRNRNLLPNKNSWFCDIGLNSGQITQDMLKEGFSNSFAIDISPYNLKNDLLRCPIENYSVYDFSVSIENQVFKKKFDLVTCFETLDLVPIQKSSTFVRNLIYVAKKLMVSIDSRNILNWNKEFRMYTHVLQNISIPYITSKRENLTLLLITTL